MTCVICRENLINEPSFKCLNCARQYCETDSDEHCINPSREYVKKEFENGKSSYWLNQLMTIERVWVTKERERENETDTNSNIEYSKVIKFLESWWEADEETPVCSKCLDAKS